MTGLQLLTAGVVTGTIVGVGLRFLTLASRALGRR